MKEKKNQENTFSQHYEAHCFLPNEALLLSFARHSVVEQPMLQQPVKGQVGYVTMVAVIVTL